MIKRRMIVIAIAALMGLTAVGIKAEPPEGKPGQRGPREGRPGHPGMFLDRMSEDLNLTEEQKTKIKAIMEQQRPQLEALRDDKTLTPEQRREKHQELREQLRAKIDAVLTPEQLEKAKQRRAEARERIEKGRRERQNRPPPPPPPAE